MRVTLHAVAVDDHQSFHDAMQETLRAAGLNDRRFRGDRSVPRRRRRTGAAGARGTPRSHATNAESMPLFELWFGPLPKPGAVVGDAVGRPRWLTPRRAGHGRSVAGPSYVAAPTRPPAEGREQSVQRLVWRYLEGFGPPTAQDVAQFALMYRPTVRAALQALDDELVHLEGPGGVELFDVPGGARTGRGQAVSAVTDGDVGQRSARLRRPQSRDPAGVPQAGDAQQRRRAAGAARRRLRLRGVAPGRRGGSRRRRSTRSRTTRGTASPP